jgi:hypothetical protein
MLAVKKVAGGWQLAAGYSFLLFVAHSQRLFIVNGYFTPAFEG